MRSLLVDTIFETYAKMILVNDDQCDIADIVLDGWLFEKKLNHSSTESVSYTHLTLPTILLV